MSDIKTYTATINWIGELPDEAILVERDCFQEAQPQAAADEPIPFSDPRVIAMAAFCREWDVKHGADCPIEGLCADLLRIANRAALQDQPND